MPTGRPTKYKPEYCQQLIDHMSQGLSFESFAADVDTWAGTLYRWEEAHPEFREAKRKGTEKCRKFYEKAGVAGFMGKIPGFNTAAWIFNMKNRFKWHDRQELEISATVETIEKGPERLVDEIKMVLNKPNEGPPQYIQVSDRDLPSSPEGLLQEQPVLDGPKVLRLQGHNG